MSLRAFFVAAVLLALPFASLSQVSKTGNAYLFRMKLVKGGAYAYDMTTSTDLGTGKPLVVPMGYSMKVLNVVKGVADVEMTTQSPMAQAPQKTTVKMDSRGAVDAQKGIDQLTGIRMPEKAVKVGESWKATQTVGTGARGIAMDSVYTFAGVQPLGKVQCAVVNVKSTGKGAFASTTTGKLYIELSNGMLYQSNLLSSIVMTQNGTSKTYKSTVTIKRK